MMHDARPIILSTAPPAYDGLILPPRWPGPGGILWRLLRRRIKITALEYLSGFDRRTVKNMGDMRGRRVLVLGKTTARLLGLTPMLCYPMVMDGVTYRQLPFPTWNSKWYINPVQAELAAMVLEDMYRGIQLEKYD